MLRRMLHRVRVNDVLVDELHAAMRKILSAVPVIFCRETSMTRGAGVETLMKRFRHELALVLLAAGLTGCASVAPSGMSSALRENGVPAQARILAVWDTGAKVNGDPVVGMRVDVRPSGRAAFEATIPKTLISRIAVAQFQMGKDISVRCDPMNPTIIAVDLEGPALSSQSGNPYADHFVRAAPGSGILPPERSPDVYLGTVDAGADDLAMVENGYLLLGTSAPIEARANLQEAIDEGKRIGAAVLVLYGRVEVSGPSLAVLPFNPGTAEAETDPVAHISSAILPGPSPRVVYYYGKYPPPILGVAVRCLSDDQRAQTRRGNGVAIFAVTVGSPAAAARIERGDILLAIDDRPVDDVYAVPTLLQAAAGRRVTIDLLRDGEPISVRVNLNPAR